MTAITCLRCKGEYFTASPQVAHVCPYCELSQEKANTTNTTCAVCHDIFLTTAPGGIDKCPVCGYSLTAKEEEFRRKTDLFNKFYYWLMPKERGSQNGN